MFLLFLDYCMHLSRLLWFVYWMLLLSNLMSN